MSHLFWIERLQHVANKLNCVTRRAALLSYLGRAKKKEKELGVVGGVLLER